MSEVCLIWLDTGKSNCSNEYFCKGRHQYTIWTFFLFHPSTEAREEIDVSIYGLLLYQEAGQVLPKEEGPWLTKKARVGSLSDTFQLLHKLERHGHFFVAFVQVCCVLLGRWHWSHVFCTFGRMFLLAYSYVYAVMFFCMLLLCWAKWSVFQGTTWIVETSIYC